MTTPTPTPLVFEQTSPAPSHVRATMVGVVLALLMGSLDQTIVATAMPRIIAELSGFAHYSSVVTGYLIASTLAIPVAGRLSDIFGRKPFFLFGVCLFVLASILCATAHNMLSLISFRCLQGVGGGTMQAMAFTTIADLFPPARRGRISGLMSAMFGIASVIGPTLGGVLTDTVGWRAIFTINLPVGVITFAVLWRFFPVSAPQANKKETIDFLGAGLLVIAFGSLLFALSIGGRDVPWLSAYMAILMATSSIFFLAFFWCELRAVMPIVALHLFRIRGVALGLFAAAQLAFALMGTTLFAPLFLQAVTGLSARASGACLIPMSLSTAFASLMTGQGVQRTGHTRVFSIVGSMIMLTGMVLLTQVSATTSVAHLTHLLMLVGLGSGMAMPIFSLIVQNAVSRRDLGAATASVQFVRSMGGSLGVALMGVLLTHSYSTQVHSHLDKHITMTLSADEMKELDDPQALLRPHADALLQHTLGQDVSHKELTPMIKSTWKNATRDALASAVRKVFTLASLVVAFGLLTLLRIQEQPLRKSNRTISS